MADDYYMKNLFIIFCRNKQRLFNFLKPGLDFVNSIPCQNGKAGDGAFGVGGGAGLLQDKVFFKELVPIVFGRCDGAKPHQRLGVAGCIELLFETLYLNSQEFWQT